MHQDLTDLARKLRQHETDAERQRWSRLRDRRLKGWKFIRQVPCGPYASDFCCGDAGIVVEVDGCNEQTEHDHRRAKYLETQGITVIRFWNNDVLSRTESVLGAVFHPLGERPAPSPGATRHPLPKGRGRSAR